VLGAVGQASAGSFFVRELHRTFPSTSLDSILRAVRAIRENATALGIVGGAFLLWSSLVALLRARERVQHRLWPPQPPVLAREGTCVADDIGSLTFLFSALVAGSVGGEFLKRYTGMADNPVIAYALSVLVSVFGVFVFLASATSS